jgi:hypothetical protein
LGIEVSISQRYAPYPAIFAGASYLSLLATSKSLEERAKIWCGGFYLAILFCVIWDVAGIRQLEKQYKKLDAGDILYPDPAYGFSVIEESKMLGIIK